VAETGSSKRRLNRGNDPATSRCEINHNCFVINAMIDDQQAPFGGFKQSGVGHELGTFGIEAFLEPVPPSNDYSCSA
jgi:acyl-CoA reductase-like NAD-dependent aldehyde dehydrogenase